MGMSATTCRVPSGARGPDSVRRREHRLPVHERDDLMPLRVRDLELWRVRILILAKQRAPPPSCSPAPAEQSWSSSQRVHPGDLIPPEAEPRVTLNRVGYAPAARPSGTSTHRDPRRVPHPERARHGADRCAAAVLGTVGGSGRCSSDDVDASVSFGCACGERWASCRSARSGVAGWQGGGVSSGGSVVEYSSPRVQPGQADSSAELWRREQSRRSARPRRPAP